MLLLLNKKYRLPATMAIVCTIALTGFKDTGIFVKDYIGVGQGATKQTVNSEKDIKIFKETEVKILKETENMFIIDNNGYQVEVPKELLVVREMDKVVEEENKEFPVDEKQEEPVEEEALNPDAQEGIARLDKVVKNGESVLNITKGDAVSIKEIRNGMYIVVDGNGVEYQLKPSDLDVRGNGAANRGAKVPKNTGAANKVVSAAYAAIGTPYVGGGTSSRGYDCSGLTYSIYLNELGIRLPRSSRDQVAAGRQVSKSELAPGDILFFRTTGSGIGHVGVYIGDNNMIHASTGQRRVMITDINSSYFAKRYVTARRIID